MTKQKWNVYRATLRDNEGETYQIFEDYQGTLTEMSNNIKLIAKNRGHTVINVNKVREYYL